VLKIFSTTIGRSVGCQIKEDDISSTFGMADKSTVFWWKKKEIYYVEEMILLKWVLKN